MTYSRTLTAAAAVCLTSLANVALADDVASVKAFYAFLSNPGSQEHAAAFKAVAADDWESIGDYSGKAKSREAFLAQLGGMSKLIPDMNWNIEAMHQDGNTFIVRGRATGTPVGPFFGVDGQGRGFDIMSIDIHTVEDGLVVRTYHVEDWSSALRQLSGK